MEIKSKDIEKVVKPKQKVEGKLIKLQLRDIRAYPNNAKIHTTEQISKIRDSIQSFGYKDFIAVDENNVIIEGHGRLQALYQLDSSGSKEISVIKITDLSEEEKKAYRIAHNKIGMDTDFDLVKLGKEFNSLEDTESFDDTGFSSEEITEIWEENDPKTADEDDFEEPKEAKYKIELGEVWELGDHRLMCGDSTSKEVVDKLMNGTKADMVFTDPPYNLGYEYNSYDDNKSVEDYKKFCKNWFIRLEEQTDKIIITCGKQNLMMWADIKYPKDIAVWIKKNGMSGGKISNLTLWEPILFYGDYDRNSRPTDIYEINLWHQKDVADTHTCPKPITLVSEIIEKYSKRTNNILDVFGGSGTTLIACEQLNRKCYMMELDPHYCSVIIERWEKLTNKQAIRLTE